MISLCTICYFLCICNDLKKKNLTGIITTASMGVFLFLTPCSTPQLFPLCSQVDLSNFILSSTCGSSTSPIARRMKFTFLNIFKDLPPPSPTHRSQLDLQSHSLAMPYIRTALPHSTSIRNIFFFFPEGIVDALLQDFASAFPYTWIPVPAPPPADATSSCNASRSSELSSVGFFS